MNTKHHSVIAELKQAVAEERRITTRILRLLRMVDEGRWFLDLGYSSLFDFAVRELGYAQDAANRRISAMRLIRDVPQIEKKIESGSMSLSVVTEASRFLRAERRSGVSRTSEQKKELVLSLDGLSKREAERTLLKQAAPETLKELQKSERVKIIGPDLTKVTLVVTKEQEEKIQKLRDLLSHRNEQGTIVGLLDLLLDEALEKHDPARIEARRQKSLSKSDKLHAPARVEIMKEFQSPPSSARPLCGGAAGKGNRSLTQIEKRDPVPAPGAPKSPQVRGGTSITPSTSSTPTRYIPAEIKRQVWMRDQGKCTYKDCGATAYIHIDHCVPHALGGANTFENLRLLCAAHNKREAEKVFGPWPATTP